MIEFFTQPPATPAPTKPSASTEAKSAEPFDKNAPEKDASFADALTQETQEADTQTSQAKPAQEKTADPAINTAHAPAELIVTQGASASAETPSAIDVTEAIAETLASEPEDDAQNNADQTAITAIAPAPVESESDSEDVVASSGIAIEEIATDNEDTAAATLAYAERDEDVIEASAPAATVAATAAAQTSGAAPVATTTMPTAVPKALAAKAVTQPVGPASAAPGEMLQPLKAGEIAAQEATEIFDAVTVAERDTKLAQDITTQTADKPTLKTAAAATFDQALNTQPTDSAAHQALAVNVAKNSIADNPAAKPLPEVIVQVPQQRADMAAKQVGLEMARQVKNGDTQFVVRMDPPELGKLDVRISVSKAGDVQANIVVEREATLDLLNRDSRSLERSLTDAGLKLEQNALNLSLKHHDGERFGNTMANSDGAGTSGDSGNGAGDEDITDIIDGATLAQMQLASGRPLDVTV